jgi:hypothetical protein
LHVVAGVLPGGRGVLGSTSTSRTTGHEMFLGLRSVIDEQA